MKNCRIRAIVHASTVKRGKIYGNATADISIADNERSDADAYEPFYMMSKLSIVQKAENHLEN